MIISFGKEYEIDVARSHHYPWLAPLPSSALTNASFVRIDDLPTFNQDLEGNLP
jgi:hypothetical protein